MLTTSFGGPQMNQTRIQARAIALAAALALGGCVSQQSYDKLAAEKSGQIDALKLEQTRLEGEVGKLQTQIKDLEAQRTRLEQQQAALEQERTQLKSASDQSQAQYTALVG